MVMKNPSIYLQSRRILELFFHVSKTIANALICIESNVPINKELFYQAEDQIY
jgi:hypothetical protein